MQPTATPRRQLLRRFLPYYRKYWKTLLFDLCCAFFTTLCDIFLPLIASDITQRAVTDPASLTVSLVLRTGGFYLVLRLIDAAANYYMASIGHIMGVHMETDMRTDLFAHLQRLSFSYYSETKIGQIMSRMTTDLFEVTEFAHHCPEEFFIAGIKIITSFVILSGMNLKLSLLMFAVLPVMFVFARHFNRRMRTAFRERNIQVGEVNSQMEDSLLGIRVVKSFANEELEAEKFDRSNRTFQKSKIASYWAMAAYSTSNRVFDGLMYVVILVAGALEIMHGRLTAAQFTAYLLYANTLLNSIRRIVDFAEQFQRGMTGIERFYEILDAPVEIQDSPDAKPLKDVQGSIDFDHVSFRYGEDEHQVLRDLTEHIGAGQSVALVGPSGGGKTTLCSLIPRFYDVNSGAIRVDGQDVRDLTLSSLRSAIGVVQQDVYLFSGSVLDNILYGRPGASREEAVEAARLAGADEFIASLPEGYDTYVGERGVKLSGGQKQRISIARVFLKNPPILILDEATSALDNESEHLVQQSLEKLAKGRTVLTIAHRLTTIRNADTIWVLTANGIEERGSHAELMRQNGLYAHMYEMYTDHIGEGE